MNTRIDSLKEKIVALYESRNPNHADWADWLYENHVFVVASTGKDLAKRYGANEELVMAAAMLHDIADAVMRREDDEHEEESFKIARSLLQETGFSEKEIGIVVDDAIRFHSCHGNNAPNTLEGRVMATADGFVHLTTDFYDFALRTLSGIESADEIKNWALPKIDRDFRKKIMFDEVREEAASSYERVKGLFDRL
jgi:putative nucleotidyltransferase with HDIG domain